MLLQELNASVADFQVDLRNLKTELHQTNERIDAFIQTYMPEDVARHHVADHRRSKSNGLISRIIKAIKNE